MVGFQAEGNVYYSVMPWTKFAEQLISTGDLDPLYILVARADWSWERKARFTIAYTLFYHAGVSAELSELRGPAFHNRARAMAEDSKTPRGSERRHFRGANALRCLDWLKKEYPEPEHWVAYISDLFGWKQRYARIQQAPAFGPWISFKVCDMLDRILGKPTNWDGFGLHDLYDAPLAGASLIGAKEGGSAADGWALLLDYMRGFKAPPSLDRPCGVAEAETVACKFKSHLNGHYPMRKDTKEIVHGLKNYVQSSQALLMAAYAKEWCGINETH